MIKYYYVTGHTSEGFVNYLVTNVKGIERIFVLNERSAQEKTIILKRLIQYFETEYPVEKICSHNGKAYIEGIILRDQKVAIITDEIHTTSLQDVEYINLYKGKKISDLLIEYEKNKKESLNEAYKYFHEALKIHDQLEKIYIQEMDFKIADKIAERLINELLGGISTQARSPHTYKRLFGTNTGEGVINVVPEIIKPLKKRIYIKGRAGTGKSVFMNKVAQACLERGFDIEVYHCSFDPDSLDMVLVPELDFCIFDSTSPHEFFPERTGDQIIDLYEEAVQEGTDEKYAMEIKKVTKDYQNAIQKGMNALTKANNLFLAQEKDWLAEKKLDFERVVQEIIQKIG